MTNEVIGAESFWNYIHALGYHDIIYCDMLNIYRKQMFLDSKVHVIPTKFLYDMLYKRFCKDYRRGPIF